VPDIFKNNLNQPDKQPTITITTNHKCYALLITEPTIQAGVTRWHSGLCYKPEGHRFDSWWCYWNFSL